MRALFAICGREYASMFRIPLGWVVVALFVCLSSLYFMIRVVIPGGPATMREVFGVWWALLLFLCPSVSMRLFSEELRTGTIETSLTAPVADGVLVVGKYLASVLFLLTMLLPTLVYVGILGWLARPDYGPVLSGYAGLLLLGMLYLAVGALASASTSSQTLAFLGTLFGLLLLDVLPAQLAPRLPEKFAKVVYMMSPNLRATDFYRGLIDTSHIAFFLGASVWFLVLAALVLQSRRWR
jgi:ABC-2 type transport system permease protein